MENYTRVQGILVQNYLTVPLISFFILTIVNQAVNSGGFNASLTPRLEVGIPEFTNISTHSNVVHTKLEWWKPR